MIARSTVFILCSLLLSVASNLFGNAPKPKLAVLVSFDQMRGDYYRLWKEHFRKDGFRRIAEQGSNFEECLYSHATTFTAPGHATLLTGVSPATHGVVANDFFDKSYGKTIYCCYDTVSGTIGNPTKKRSPNTLLTPTVGDHLQSYFSESKVIGVAQKDRAAILMAGKKATSAYWFDIAADGMTSSTYYHKTNLPNWVMKWKQKNPLSAYERAVWKPSNISYPEPDNARWESPFPDGARTFPHTIPPIARGKEKFSDAFLMTPYSVEYLFSFAQETILQEKLGADSIPDILCIGVSTTDICGHQFGPESRELFELYLQCDEYIAKFMQYLDSTIGKDNYVIAISSDHGVGMIPERAAAVGLGGSRISFIEIAEAIEGYLATKFPRTSEKPWIKALELPWIHLSLDSATTAKYPEEMIADSLSSFIERTFSGVYYAFPSYKIRAGEQGKLSKEDFALVKNSYNKQRCGEVVVYTKEHWLFGSTAASHGTPHRYDRHVPLMFYGKNVPIKNSSEPCSVTDLAPTFAKLLRIPVPETEGQVLLDVK